MPPTMEKDTFKLTPQSLKDIEHLKKSSKLVKKVLFIDLKNNR